LPEADSATKAAASCHKAAMFHMCGDVRETPTGGVKAIFQLTPQGLHQQNLCPVTYQQYEVLFLTVWYAAYAECAAGATTRGDN